MCAVVDVDVDDGDDETDRSPTCAVYYAVYCIKHAGGGANCEWRGSVVAAENQKRSGLQWGTALGLCDWNLLVA